LSKANLGERTEEGQEEGKLLTVDVLQARNKDTAKLRLKMVRDDEKVLGNAAELFVRVPQRRGPHRDHPEQVMQGPRNVFVVAV
jgi:hypothetical protein